MKKVSLRSRVLVALCVLVAVAAFGCSQGGDKDQAAVTEAEETTKEAASSGQTTAAGGVAQGGAQETTRDEQPPPQEAREGQQRTSREAQAPDEQGARETVTVRITGTEGLSFSGNVGSARELKRVKGAVPEEYELSLNPDAGIVTTSVHKQSPEEGALGIEIVSGEQVVASKETSTPTGVVNVVWPPRGSGSGGG